MICSLLKFADLKDDSISSNDDDDQLRIRNSCQDTNATRGYGPTSSTYNLFHETRLSESDDKQTTTAGLKTPLNNKPRIWSLAEMASKEEKDHKRSHPLGVYGKVQPFITSQIQYPISIKPDRSKLEIYQNLNYSMQSADPHAMAANEYALIESYQRALAAHNSLQSGSQAYLSILPNQMDKNAAAAAAAAHAAQSLIKHQHQQHQQHQHQHQHQHPIQTIDNTNNATNISSLQSSSKESQSPIDNKGVILSVNSDSNKHDIDINKRQINT